jgi:hypothetical protein
MPKKIKVPKFKGAPSSPTTSHAKAITVPKSTHRSTHPNRIKNLGKYAHAAKLPSGAKIGVKTRKPKAKYI